MGGLSLLVERSVNISHWEEKSNEYQMFTTRVLFVVGYLSGFVAAQEDSVILETIEGKGAPPSGQLLEYFEDAKGYLAEPEGEGPFGAIILIHEWNGVVERIKQVADALAKEDISHWQQTSTKATQGRQEMKILRSCEKHAEMKTR